MQVVDDAIGSYANDAKTTGVQMPVAFGIVLALLLVNQSVDLHNEPSRQADEIDDV